MSPLPSEVIDLIIDKLHDHPAALRACSLVCRNWLAASRHHLYSEVYVTGNNLNSFIDLTGHPHDSLSSRLQSLHFTRFRPDQFETLWPLLPGFPQLRGLHVHGRLKFWGRYELPQAVGLPPITSLSLSSVIFTSYKALNGLLLRFPAVQVLSLDCTFSGPADLPEDSPSTLNLRRLAIVLTTEMLGWLAWNQFHLRPECIDMDIGTSKTGLDEYFKVLGSRLKHLTLRFQTSGSLAIFSEQPLLAHNTALQSLRMTNAFSIKVEGAICVAPGLERLLQHLQSSKTSTLEELVFTVTLSPGWSPTSPNRVAQILDNWGVPSKLRKVEFFGPWDRADDVLRQQFCTAVFDLVPLLHSRGVVFVATHKFM